MRNPYIVKDETQVLKGIMALLILAHYVYQDTLFGSENPFVDYFFRSLGYIGVACFFYISGYGLTVSNIASWGGDFNTFVLKRILPLYIINVLLIIVYWIAYTLLLDGVETKALIQSFFFGGTIVPAGWYLQELLLFYLLYWMTWKLFPKNYARIIVALIIVFIAIAIVKLQSHWYLSSFAFAAGIIYAKSKESIDYIICSFSNYKAVLLSSIIILIVVYMVLFFFEIRFAFYTPIKVFVIAPLLPLILTLLSSRKKYKKWTVLFYG